LSGPRILLVISDPTRRPAFSAVFKSLGCQVFTTVTAENALVAMERVQPNVILPDMAIEDLKSSDFLQKIKENPKFRSIPIVSYTRFFTYKLTHPNLLSKDQASSESEDSKHALDILKENIGLVPGEIIFWVEDAIIKQNIEVPPLLTVAAKILRNYNALFPKS